MIGPVVGFQIILTAISAVLGAGALLWMQTLYRRIKLLRGLEEEIQGNLSAVGEVGTRLHETRDKNSVSDVGYSNEIYRTLKVETPLLYARISKDFSLISMAYVQIEGLRSVSRPIITPSGTIDVILEKFESNEGFLLLAHRDLKALQQEFFSYRAYASLFLRGSRSSSPELYRTVKANEGQDPEEVVWRPTGRSAEDMLKEYLEE
jgi:hypothetical protein